MYKLTIISALVAISHAAVLVNDGHNHAVSSQSILHQPNQINTHYTTPVLTHTGPILTHSGPVLTQSLHSTPVLTHSGPVLTHSGPLVQYSALQQHSGPLLHSSPLVQHVGPSVQIGQAVHASPIAVGRPAEHIEEHAPAHYEFSYSVEDPHTGDHKSQHETRNGDVVKGEYSLVQPDGSVRKVEYTADDHSGFNAVVHNSPPTGPIPAPVHQAPVHAAVPVLAHH